MEVNYKLLKNVLTHFLVWVGFIGYELFLLLLLTKLKFNIVDTVFNFLPNILLFYLNCLVLVPLFNKHRQYPGYVLSLLAALAGFTWLRYGIDQQLLPALLGTTPPPVISYKIYIIQSIYRGLYFIFLSFGYWFAQNAIRLEKQKREQEHELRVTERNLMQANIAFLKNQINPHFLFNSLNFLYAQVYPHSEESAKGILLLSDIMRYALKEDDNNGKVMLEKEVQHLHNYIAINQLRFNNRLQIRFEEQGSLQFLMILPLVLITFVENCFKHGELSDPQNPLQIQLKTVDNELFFQTRNKKRSGPKEKSTGIGLDNTRQRLDMVYAGRYNLTVNDEQDYYTCSLIMKL